MRTVQLTLAVLLASTVSLATAQAVRPLPSEQVAGLDELKCRREVREYISGIRFIRETAGDKMGSRIASSYVSETEIERISSTQGPCAAAQALRSKGTPR